MGELIYSVFCRFRKDFILSYLKLAFQSVSRRKLRKMHEFTCTKGEISCVKMGGEE